MAIAKPSLPWPCGRSERGRKRKVRVRGHKETTFSDTIDRSCVSGKTATRSRSTSSSRWGAERARRARARDRVRARDSESGGTRHTSIFSAGAAFAALTVGGGGGLLLHLELRELRGRERLGVGLLVRDLAELVHRERGLREHGERERARHRGGLGLVRGGRLGHGLRAHLLGRGDARGDDGGGDEGHHCFVEECLKRRVR